MSLGSIDGAHFALLLNTLEGRAAEHRRVHDIFGESIAQDRLREVDTLVQTATITKVTALMLWNHGLNEQKPNPSKLRREIRKYTKLLSEPTDLRHMVQQAVWAWSEEVSKFS